MSNPDKCVIFDFDGTLADSFELIIKNLYRSNDLLGISLKNEDFNHFKSIGIANTIKELKISKLKLLSMVKSLQKMFAENINEIKFFDGTDQMLRSLDSQDYVLGILTSNSADNVKTFLKNNNISELFDFVYADPSLFSKSTKLKKIIKKYNLDPQHVIYVGDEIRDIEAGSGANLKTVAVTWGYSNEELLKSASPTFIAHTNTELLEFLLKQ